MKQYKTVDVDYTNCHPVIAEALKQGKHIWCCNPHDERKTTIVVIGYSDKSHSIYPYMALQGSKLGRYSRTWIPIETKKKFKSAPEIIQWCLDNGWVPAENTSYLFRESCSVSHQYNKLKTNLIKFYAGKEYKPDEIHDMYIHPDWLDSIS